ncbi:hypothetical protein E0K89_013015 [Aquicoccus sp. SCR17]|nr:hypothetical protein [Carideicomes alvinocaridis]
MAGTAGAKIMALAAEWREDPGEDATEPDHVPQMKTVSPPAEEAAESDDATAEGFAGKDPAEVSLKLRKRDLIAATAARTGRRKGEVRPVVEAMLAAMGEALAEGRDLELQPMGKFKVQHVKPLAKGRVISGRLRQKDE